MTVGTITGGKPVPMYILARLNTNGQGIVLANAYKDLNIRTDSSPLKEAFAKTRAEWRAQNQQEQIKVAVTFPGAPMICGCATGWLPAALILRRTFL